MRAAPDPVGPDNDAAIRESCGWAAGSQDRIIAAWGTHGAFLERGPAVERLLRAQPQPLHHLGLTLGGHPKHPLYIPYSQSPILWSPTD